MQVLSVTSECVPLVKTGGLADVAGALPAALAAQGVEMRTLIPGYPAVMQAVGETTVEAGHFTDLFGGPTRILQAKLGDLPLYALDAPHLFDRAGSLYIGPDGRDWPDNATRFAAFSMVAALIAAGEVLDWRPDVLHLHDWQAALAAVYLGETSAKGRVGTLLTIHNIAFQGHAHASLVEPLSLPPAGFTMDGYEYYGHINALKAGIVYADKISTVSPTYAQEILTPEFGIGLDGVLRKRSADLVGILNGIDLNVWAPPYKSPRGKPKHKKKLQKDFGLPDAPGPLFVVVSRLTAQKGLDLLLDALPALLAEGAQLAVLGTGETGLENAFLHAAAYSENISVEIGYNEALSHELIAGGDAILVPSRFEPCGLTQLYGLHHGTIPLVALTGGLADTVIPANKAALSSGAATGFQFHPIKTDALVGAIRDLCRAYRDPEIWAKLQKNAMAQPVGWDRSAAEYAALYQSIAK